MDAGFKNLHDMELQVRAMAAASSPSLLFKLLHEACAWAAPRAAVFLVRRGKIRGWNSSGYDPSVARALREHCAPLEPSWVDGEGRLNFGQPQAGERCLLPLTVRDKPIAFVLAERSVDEGPWFPSALRLLVEVAQMRLELDLALRKLGAIAEGARPAAATATVPADRPAMATRPAETAPIAMPSTDVATLPDPGDLEPETGEVDVAAQEEPAELVAARRYARLVATDIRLYNEEAVVLGQREGDLVERIGDQLGLGKQTFLRRHGALGPTGLQVLRDAYVQVLAAGKAELIPAAALD
jgi:hypothetical protein